MKWPRPVQPRAREQCNGCRQSGGWRGCERAATTTFGEMKFPTSTEQLMGAFDSSVRFAGHVGEVEAVRIIGAVRVECGVPCADGRF